MRKRNHDTARNRLQTLTSFFTWIDDEGLTFIVPGEKARIKGSINQQFIRCGRPSCKCAQGELHGPYWYLFYRVGGRQHKKYLRAEDVGYARKACQAERDFHHRIRARRGHSILMFRQMRQCLRDMTA